MLHIISKKMPVICLMGPTASGKTQLAVDLVQQLPCDIISVDSAMVYRGMDIGTAKPDASILQVAPHRLLDICDPAEPYSAAQFIDDAMREIEDVHRVGRIPLLVGGTMMYFHALQEGLSELPSADLTIRNKLNAEARESGWLALHERLKQVDSLAAERIHPNDSQRVQRALEVYELTGRSLSDWQQEKNPYLSSFQVMNLGVSPRTRDVLHQRIAKRFDLMLAQGFIQEVENLVARGDLDRNVPSMRAVGYRQVWEYLNGEYDYQTLRERGIIATRQLAKRQLTWLRHWAQPMMWFDSEAPNLRADVIQYLSSSF